MAYNGWSNYATWRIALDVQDTMMSKEDLFYEIYTNGGNCVPTNEGLADSLKETFEDDLDNCDCLTRDLLGTILQEVDWYEIITAHYGNNIEIEYEEYSEKMIREAKWDREERYREWIQSR